jgi:hypothetical protein
MGMDWGAFSAYCRVPQVALGNGLEQCGLADIGQANLRAGSSQRSCGGTGTTKATHNAALQVVAGTAQENLLLLHSLFGRHLGPAFAVVASGDVDESAVEHRLRDKSRASCGVSKEG